MELKNIFKASAITLALVLAGCGGDININITPTVNDNTDSSARMKFAKIWYGGSDPKVGGEGDDVNGLTLNAVGSGSSFDFDVGYRGNMQFLYVQHGTVTTRDGAKAVASAEAPASHPTIANVTIVTADGLSVRDEDPSAAFKFDDEFTADMYNMLAVKTVS